jgi:hypothetical protein
MSFKRLRTAIDLDVKGRKLWHHKGAVQPLEESLIDRTWRTTLIHKSGLELKAAYGTLSAESSGTQILA